MKQLPIKSQFTPIKKESQTSQILYREPTHKEMYRKKYSALSNIFWWIFLIVVFFFLGIFMITIAERESANQIQAISKSIGGTKQ